MSFFETLGNKTCLFHIRLSIGPNTYLVCDTSINPHLMKGDGSWSEPARKFLIYPEPGRENQFRMQLESYLPDKWVVANGNENPFKPWADLKDSDEQRFRFIPTSAPAKVPAGTPRDVEWYLIERVAGNKVLTWGGVVGKYAHAMTTANRARDHSKVWFEPVDVKAPAQKPVSNTVEPEFPDGPPVFVSLDVIPAALVNPPAPAAFNTKWDQIKNDPYYYLELEKFWRKSDEPVELFKGGKETRTVKHFETFGMEHYTAIQQTIGHTFKAELEVGYKGEVGAYGSLKTSYEYSSQRRTDRSLKTMTERGEEKTTSKEFSFASAANQKELHQPYQLIERYTLKNSRGKTVGKPWDYQVPDQVRWLRTIQPA